MKKINCFCLTLGLVAIFCLQACLVNCLWAQDDWQYWSAYNFRHKINDRWGLVLNPQVRIFDDATDFSYYESRFGIVYGFNKHFDLGVNYLFSNTKNTLGKWTDENNLELEATPKWSLAGFKFSDRNRFEYRIVNGKPKNRYRNNLKISRSVKMGKNEWIPFIGNELFYDFKASEYNQNRFSVGIGKNLSKNLALEIYLMSKMDKTGRDWKNSDIVGTNLQVSF